MLSEVYYSPTQPEGPPATLISLPGVMTILISYARIITSSVVELWNPMLARPAIRPREEEEDSTLLSRSNYPTHILGTAGQSHTTELISIQ